jgi:protoporphyrinogen/coproporphyrinogen III oxidase
VTPMGLRVVVIGGGAAGLAASHALRERAARERIPLDLRVLEAGQRAGGHVGTVREDGFAVETGPNAFLSGESVADELIDSLGLTPELVDAEPSSRKRFLVRRGRLRRLPAGPLGLITTRALSLRGRLRLAMEPWIPARPPALEESVAEFGRRRFGREAAESLADAVVAGTSAGSAATLSMAAAYPALLEMERSHGSVVRAMIARRKAGARAAVLRSFARGMGTLVEALAARLGPALSLGDPVERVVRDGATWRVERARGEPLTADRVILAVPAGAAARMLAGCGPILATALAAIPTAGLAAVGFAWRAEDLPHPLDGYGYLVPAREGLLTLGMVWESSLFPGRAPAGRVLVRMMLGGERSPGAADRSEPELLALATEEAGRALRIRRPPERGWIFRWPGAIPQYTRGHRERVATIRREAAAPGGLELCGSSYDGISLTAAIASGVAAAERIALA